MKRLTQLSQVVNGYDINVNTCTSAFGTGFETQTEYVIFSNTITSSESGSDEGEEEIEKTDLELQVR